MDWISLILIPGITSLVLVVILLTGFAYLTLFERKMIGRFQLRIGPNRAWKFGLGHPIADALKMIFKEEFIPARADKLLYVIAPKKQLLDDGYEDFLEALGLAFLGACR